MSTFIYLSYYAMRTPQPSPKWTQIFLRWQSLYPLLTLMLTFSRYLQREGLNGPVFHAKDAHCAHGINATSFAFPKVSRRGMTE